MTRKQSTTLMLAAVAIALILIFLHSNAFAQVPGGQCNGPGSEPGTFAISPDSGPAGSQAVVSGSFQVFPSADVSGAPAGDPTVATAQGDVQAFWQETGSGNPVPLGGFMLTIDPQLIAHFSGNVTIPATAATGPHEVMLWVASATDPNCVIFTVVQSAGSDAYTQTATALPSTGMGMLVISAGAALIALGFKLRWRRKHRTEGGS